MGTEYNRQYVGARYVPQFFKNPDGSWDWAAGFQYEPLTMVKYGENTYTSKMLVPATVGSPNLNQEYWAMTGNYNGIITELNNNVNTLLSNKPNRILWLGDSYTAATGVDNGYVQQLAVALNKIGIDFTFFGIPGVGFVPQGGISYLSMLQSAPVKNYDRIIVQGIINDFPNGTVKDGYLNAIQSFVNYVKDNYPNTKLSVIVTDKNINLKLVNKIMEYNNSYFKPCGIQLCMDFWSVLCSNKMFLEDGLHPNCYGNDVLFSATYNWLINGNVGYDFTDSTYQDNQILIIRSDSMFNIAIGSPNNLFNGTIYNGVLQDLGDNLLGYHGYSSFTYEINGCIEKNGIYEFAQIQILNNNGVFQIKANISGIAEGEEISLNNSKFSITPFAISALAFNLG